MTLLLTLLILAVVGLVAAVAAGRITGGLDEPASSLPGRGLPEGRVGAGDLERVRFSPALRGYRMDEVDDVLDRLTEELSRRDEEITALRRQGWSGAGPESWGDGVRADLDDESGGDPEAELDDALPWARTREQQPAWRHRPHSRYPEPFTPPPGIPAAPPAGRDEHGGGR